MYKQYWNDYEKRADQIRKAAQAVAEGAGCASEEKLPLINQKGVQAEQKCAGVNEQKNGAGLLGNFSKDDILLLALLFVLISSEKKDTTLIIILGYLFLSGL